MNSNQEQIVYAYMEQAEKALRGLLEAMELMNLALERMDLRLEKLEKELENEFRHTGRSHRRGKD